MASNNKVNTVLTNVSGSIVIKRRMQKWKFLSGLMKCLHVTKFSSSPKFRPISFYIGEKNFYRPQRSCGKVMFSQVCAKNSVYERGACMAGGMCGRGHAWQEGHVWWCGMHGRGACVTVGHAWSGGFCVWQGEACMAGGVCGRGCAFQEKWQLQWAVYILLECILVF